KGKGMFGLATSFMDNTAEFIHRMEPELGDFYQIRVPAPNVFITFRPSLIAHITQKNARNYLKSKSYDQMKMFLGNGLVTSEGDFWKKQRRIIQPVFYKDHLKKLYEKMVDVTEGYIKDLGKRVDQNPELCMSHEMMHVTAEIVMQTLFSTSNPQDKESMYQNVTYFQKYTLQHIYRPYLKPLHRINGKTARFNKGLKSFDDMVYRLISERKGKEDQFFDLLSLLLATKDADTGERMSDLEARDEAITLYMAGHETSANGMSWTLHLLSKHPEIVEKIREEDQRVLNGRLPEFADLRNLPYVRQVVDEGMRIFPPVHSFSRRTIEADVLDGVPIPANSNLMISVFGLHRSPKHWKDPMVFNPDRFTPENVKARPRLTYMPFGAGSRMCIGNHFALMEMQLLLLMIVRHFDFKMVPGHPVETEPLITLKPKHGMQMCLTRVQ
ncbi:MAG: cytochrome P450, partial [Bacteroidota bacterium]